ncbi:MAG: polysaccharide biosynthesis tyrosine autokinase [Deltaproteobacteria bacterium]|nr:polysaccharide biosynthesis tyrosine autokinase [Deltaproteobacteria bacterium]
MKNELKNYYEILDLSLDADMKALEKAYKKAMSIYGQDSAAIYSLYTEKEKEMKVSNIKEAYHTLKDPEARRLYDRKLDNMSAALSEDSNLKSELAVSDEVGLQDCLVLKKPLAVMEAGDPLAAEHYRILYTKLEQIHMNNNDNVFALTSAIKGEGKTTTSLNLAYIISEEFRKKVILLETDLRKNSIAENYLQPFRGSGLVDVLSGRADLDEAIYPLSDSNLYVLPSGMSVRNSTELLASPKMPQIIEILKSEFDYVIIDCPPVLPLADMNVLSKMVDDVLLVVQAGKTHKDLVAQAIKALSRGKVAGFILNGTEKSAKNYYYY